MTGAGRLDRTPLLADAFVHAAGLVLAAVGAIVMAARLAGSGGGPDRTWAVAVYLAGLVAMLGCSALYSLWPPGRTRDVLRRFDHAAIFVMIAGTYTPLTQLRLGEPWRSRLTIVVWTAAAAGVVLKLWQPRRVEAISVALYLALGWVGVITLDSFLAALAPLTLVLILLGGLIYSGGVIFHLSARWRFQRALWHGCVLLGAVIHYFALLTLLS
jgi:hemolysin III